MSLGSNFGADGELPTCCASAFTATAVKSIQISRAAGQSIGGTWPAAWALASSSNFFVASKSATLIV
jgi:hypothetical protein